MNEMIALNLENLIRIIIVWVVFFVVLPGFIFHWSNEPQGDPVGTNALDALWVQLVFMIASVITAGYLLIALRLYEVMSIIPILGAVIVWRNWSYVEIQQIRTRWTTLGLDWFEGRWKIGDAVKPWFSGRFVPWLKRREWKFLVLLGSGFVVALAAYLRFYDPLRHLAPALSDSYVTLAWMKYMDQRILFHDGIYTHGFHIYLSFLHKFAAVNPVFMLNMIGPFNGLLIMAGIYYAGRRITMTYSGGLIPALLYGFFIMYLPSEAVRQAATNSQEFALVFLMPALVWTLEYLKTGKKRWLAAALAGVLLIVYIHAVVSFFAVCGLAAAVFSAWPGVRLKEYGQRVLRLTLAMGGAGVLGLTPLVLGTLFGRHLHGSSAAFATSTEIPALPQITWPCFLLILLALVGMSSAILGLKKQRETRPAILFCGWLLVMAVALYLGPYWGLVNQTLWARSGELLAITICICLSWAAAVWEIGWRNAARFILFRLKRQMTDRTTGRGAAVIGLVTVMLVTGFGLQYGVPKPFVPYRMQYDAAVRQYLRIAGSYRPTEWMLIGPAEFYSLVLGMGWHIRTDEFLKDGGKITRTFIPYKGKNLQVPDLFIFVEKRPFFPADGPTELGPLYRKRAGMERTMLKRMRAADTAGKVFYEDRNLVVYHYHFEIDPRERYLQLWGVYSDSKKR